MVTRSGRACAASIPVEPSWVEFAAPIIAAPDLAHRVRAAAGRSDRRVARADRAVGFAPPLRSTAPASLQVQRLLAARGQRRAPSVPDVMIAAERARLTVLHTDKDFELIVEVTLWRRSGPRVCKGRGSGAEMATA